MYDMKLSLFTNDDGFPFFIQYGYHDTSMFIHNHKDFFELVIVLDGKATHVVGDEKFPIKKGDVFVMGQGVSHEYIDVDSFRICNIMFRPEFFLSANYDIKQFPGFHALFILEPQFNSERGFKSYLKLSAHDFLALENIIDAAIKEYRENNPGRKTLLIGYFLQIVVMLSRLYSKTDSAKEIEGIANAAAYMESHYKEHISIEELINISHYSSRHFLRLFNSTYRTSPQAYLTGIRLRHACSLLCDTNLSVTEIALQCGFNDPNYFGRIFKKNIGIAPGTYRKTAVTHNGNG